MIEFTIYDSASGRVISTGICPESQLHGQAGIYSLAIGTYPSDKYYWDNDFIEMPPKPDGEYLFDYSTKQWVLDTVKTLLIGKVKRNQLLLASDWTQVPDSPLTSEVKAQWITYRQALRDMTEQDYLTANFPAKP